MKKRRREGESEDKKDMGKATKRLKGVDYGRNVKWRILKISEYDFSNEIYGVSSDKRFPPHRSPLIVHAYEPINLCDDRGLDAPIVNSIHAVKSIRDFEFEKIK